VQANMRFEQHIAADRNEECHRDAAWTGSSTEEAYWSNLLETTEAMSCPCNLVRTFNCRTAEAGRVRPEETGSRYQAVYKHNSVGQQCTKWHVQAMVVRHEQNGSLALAEVLEVQDRDTCAQDL